MTRTHQKQAQAAQENICSSAANTLQLLRMAGQIGRTSNLRRAGVISSVQEASQEHQPLKLFSFTALQRRLSAHRDSKRSAEQTSSSVQKLFSVFQLLPIVVCCPPQTARCLPELLSFSAHWSFRPLSRELNQKCLVTCFISPLSHRIATLVFINWMKAIPRPQIRWNITKTNQQVSFLPPRTQYPWYLTPTRHRSASQRHVYWTSSCY